MASVPMSEAWLREVGFRGFVGLHVLRETSCSEIPSAPGVYVVLGQSPGVPAFLDRGSGGFFKNRDPNVAVSELAEKWVNGAETVYVGKAGGPGLGSTLAKRVRQYLAFGAGKRAGHWGGRHIWQLPGAGELRLCWLPTTAEAPRQVEKRLIDLFETTHGAMPFANRRR